MNIKEQIAGLPSNDLVLQHQEAKQIIKGGIYGVNDLQILQELESEIKRRKQNKQKAMQTSYTKEEQRKYAMGYHAGYKRAVKENGGKDGIGNSLLRQRAQEVQNLKAQRLGLLVTLVATWAGFLLGL